MTTTIDNVLYVSNTNSRL